MRMNLADILADAASKHPDRIAIRHRADSIYLKQEVEAGVLGEIYYAKATALRRRERRPSRTASGATP